MVERSLRMRDVPGSIPGVSRNIFVLSKYLTVVGFEPTPPTEVKVRFALHHDLLPHKDPPC